MLLKMVQFASSLRLKPVKLKSTRPSIEWQETKVAQIAVSPLVVVFFSLQWFFVFIYHGTSIDEALQSSSVVRGKIRVMISKVQISLDYMSGHIIWYFLLQLNVHGVLEICLFSSPPIFGRSPLGGVNFGNPPSPHYSGRSRRVSITTITNVAIPYSVCVF